MPAGTIRGGIRIKYQENKIKQKNFIFHQYWGIGKYINLAPEFQIKSWILKYSAEIHVHKFTFENSSPISEIHISIFRWHIYESISGKVLFPTNLPTSLTVIFFSADPCEFFETHLWTPKFSFVALSIV